MSGCDIIEDWNESDHSGPGGRLEQLDEMIQEFMASYGFGGAEVGEQSGLMEDEGVPARYDPDSNTIYFDADYLAGDEITTTVSVKSIDERDGKGFYVFESTSTNQRDETVCVGTWTNIVRGG